MDLRIGVLTISDRVSAGTMEDAGGVAVSAALTGPGRLIAAQEAVPDERDRIAAVLTRWCDEGLDAIFTTGGTGLSPRDVTPEATLSVANRLVPGIAEVLRARGLEQTPMSMLSRGVAVQRGRTLIVNLPGSPRGAAEGAEIVGAVLEHAVAIAHGGKH